MTRAAFASPFLLLPALLLASSAHAQAVDWKLDRAHSTVGFTARHLAFAKVRGEFTKFEVTKLQADAKTGKLTALHASVDAKSVDTGIGKRDAHLRSDDFFAADKHPKMSLVLKSIQSKGNGFKAVVALTIRGTTKDVSFGGELLGVKTLDLGRGPQQRIAYEATATIDRKAFGLKFNGLAEGVSVVGDKVELNLEASFWRPAK